MLYASVTRVTKKNVCNFHPGQRIDQFNTRLLIFSTIFPSSLLLLPFHRGDTSLRLNDRNMLMRGGKLEIRRIYIYTRCLLDQSIVSSRSGKSCRWSSHVRVNTEIIVLFGKIDFIPRFIPERLICGIWSRINCCFFFFFDNSFYYFFSLNLSIIVKLIKITRNFDFLFR